MEMEQHIATRVMKYDNLHGRLKSIQQVFCQRWQYTEEGDVQK